MTEDQKNIITATVPVLREHGVALTTHFYKRMFLHHPSLKNIFNLSNQKNGKQQQALALAVLAYAEHISGPAVLLPELERIGHKHVSLDIRPEHYPIVGNHLLASIKEVLGEAATPDILDAWEAAYNQLADLMIKVEGGMYEKARNSPGGWTGWRPFVVTKKKKESEEITSFYLKPKDGGQVLKHTPGQFISLRLNLPELGLNQARQYSISSIPDPSFYRISVKKEKDKHLNIDGLISNHLHLNINEGDVVELTAPAGNFTLGKKLDSPTTFISGGVGLTPLMSMLLSASQQNPDHSLTWIHSCRNEQVHAFKEPLQEIFEGHPQISSHVFYDELREGNQKEGINKGPMNLRGIAGLPKDGKYYICGPAGFIKKHRDDLVELGVPESSIEFEEFGPQLLHLN